MRMASVIFCACLAGVLLGEGGGENESEGEVIYNAKLSLGGELVGSLCPSSGHLCAVLARVIRCDSTVAAFSINFKLRLSLPGWGPSFSILVRATLSKVIQSQWYAFESISCHADKIKKGIKMSIRELIKYELFELAYRVGVPLIVRIKPAVELFVTDGLNQLLFTLFSYKPSRQK